MSTIEKIKTNSITIDKLEKNIDINERVREKKTGSETEALNRYMIQDFLSKMYSDDGNPLSIDNFKKEW